MYNLIHKLGFLYDYIELYIIFSTKNRHIIKNLSQTLVFEKYYFHICIRE